MRNNHFSKKHAFSRCGTTIFLKNMRSAGAEQSFSKKTCGQQVRNNCFRKKRTFQGVGTTVFGKNARSKGLEQLFSKKTNVPRGWTTVFRKKDSYSELKSATKWRYMLYIRVRET